MNFVVFEIAGDSSKVRISDIVRYRTPLGKIHAPAGYSKDANNGDNLETIPSVVGGKE